MAVAFRASASVTNAVAGTTVVVPSPAGTTNGDQLIAFIASTNVPGHSAPSGWTLVANTSAGTVKLTCWRKLAASEGASWTWTLGSAERNWGWVGAYTGVDPSTPVFTTETDNTLTTSTVLSLDQGTLVIPARGASVSAAAAVRAASGVATTWTHSSANERADVSTNAGAGTDIAGVVGDRLWDNDESAVTNPSMTASQAQTAGAAIGLTLTPYFTPYNAAPLAGLIIVEAAFGADPDSDQSTWVWTDISRFVHDTEQPVVLNHGRANRSSVADPSRIAFTVLNRAGEFTHPTGAYTAYMVRNLPIRVRLTGFGVADSIYNRGTAFLASAQPRWDQTTNWAVVDIVAQGRLRRLQQHTEALHSAAWNAIQRVSVTDPTPPIAYWPFEDQAGATVAASAVPGVGPAEVTAVTFGADSTVLGSDSLAVLSTTSTVRASVPTYEDTEAWTVAFVVVVPAEPAVATTLLDTFTTGTATGWTVGITPGAPSTVFLQVYDSGGTSIFLRTGNLNETLFYDRAATVVLSVEQNGTSVDIDFSVWWLDDAAGTLAGTAFTDTIASRTVGTVTSFRIPPAAGLNGAAFGHLNLRNDALGFGSSLPSTVIEANAGDWPATRFQRLCEEAGVPYTFEFSDNQQLEMGPQGVDTFMAQLRECEDVEGCVVNDSGNLFGEWGVLWFPARDDRENIDASLTLDVTLGQVMPDFAPALDDQDIVNDVEVTRSGGSSARIVDDASVALEGLYRQQVTLNLDDDTQLAHLAGWRVNLGTVRGMRFPTVSWNMRASPELAQEWLATRLFNRVDILHPPSQYPPDAIQAILEGYTETLSVEQWVVQGNLSPYGPNKVFVLATPTSDAGTYVGRLDTDPLAAVRGALTSTATSIPFDPGFRWTTTADDFDPDLRVRLGYPGELVEVTTIATTAATFVAAGAMSSADNAAVTPALYAGNTANDWICVLARIRDASAAGTLTTPTGYTRIAIRGWTASSPMQLFVKVHSGTESNPTVTPTGGAAGDTVSAVTFGLRNMPITLTDLNDAVVESGSLTNGSAQNVAYPGLAVSRDHAPFDGCVVLLLGGKDDDWTSVATVSGFAEAVDAFTLTGNDQALVVDYLIQTTATAVPDGSFVVTGGAAAISGGAAVAFAGGFQTLTAIRSVNGVTKAHTASTAMTLEDAYALGM